MHKLLKSTLPLALLLALAGRVEAQTRVGAAAAWHEDVDFGVGAFVVFPLAGVHPNLAVEGDFTYFFPDGFDYFEINGNLIYTFPVEADVSPWAMGGLNLARVSVDVPGFGDASETEVGVNLGGGVTFSPASSISPLVGAKIELGGGEGFVIFGGLSFALGG